MSPEPRAVVFDMDDTLYPFRRFQLSGFAAVATSLAKRHAVEARVAMRTLVRASRGRDRGREIQSCFATLGLPAAEVPLEVARVRDHQPSLRLPREAARVLASLRRTGWRLGVLTNGPRPLQARKVSALGLHARVDEVVFASDHGSGAGKPDPAPFAEIAARLDVPAHRIVMVGDDEACDIQGAITAGMHAVRCAVWREVVGLTQARAVVDRLLEVPALAGTLVAEGSKRHAA